MASAHPTSITVSSDKRKPSPYSHYMVAWGLAMLAFGLGSLKGDSIKHAFPFCCYPGFDYPLDPRRWTFSGSAFAFWIPAWLWAILYRLRLKAESKQAALVREQAEKLAGTVNAIQGGTNKLQDATTAVLGTVNETAQKANTLEKSVNEASRTIGKINEAVQTLPPESYVTTLGEYTQSCHILCGGTTPRQAHAGDIKADLEPVIRKLLGTMALLAETYDGGGSRYAANVMYFVASTEPEFQDSAVQRYQHFLPVPLKAGYADALKGALVLRKALTATADGTIDDKIQEISFPIPEQYKDDQNKFRVLPGAALAYALSQSEPRPDRLVYCLSDLQTIGTLLRDKYAFDDKVIGLIESEYNEEKRGRWVRSGLSFPLFKVETDESRAAQEKVIGVLNIHCNREQVLKGDKTQTLFARTTIHFVNDIGEAMGLWLGLKVA